MSGIVGSRLNTRGSGLVGSLGSDGQVFTSSGAGAGAVFEAVSGGAALTGSTNNTVTTVTGADAIQGEASMTYDGTTLELTTSGGGLKLDGLASSGVNTLDDYEEGEVENGLEINGTEQEDYSSGRDNIQYTKVGRMVHLQCLLDTNGQTLVDIGTIKIRLPFAVASSSAASFQGGKAFVSPYVSGTSHHATIYMDPGNTVVGMNTFWASGSASDGAQVVCASTSDRIFIHMCWSYQTSL